MNFLKKGFKVLIFDENQGFSEYPLVRATIVIILVTVIAFYLLTMVI